MEISEAIGVAQRMKNTFRAFEHLEDVLTTANAAKGSLSELEASIKQKQKEKEEIDGKIARSNDTLANLQDAIAAKQLEVRKAEEAAAKKVAEAQVKADEALEEVEKNVQNEKDGLAKDLKEAEANHQISMDGLQKAQEEKSKELEEILKKISTAKAQMKKAFGNLEE